MEVVEGKESVIMLCEEKKTIFNKKGKMNERARGCGNMKCFGFDTAIVFMNSLQLWLSSQGLHRTRSVSISTQNGGTIIQRRVSIG